MTTRACKPARHPTASPALAGTHAKNARQRPGPSLRRTLLAAAMAWPLSLIGTAAFAQGQGAYPNRPIKPVVPGPAGSSFDNSARAIAEPMAKALGVPVVIDNRPGATSTIGSDAAAKAPADGYSLLFVSTPFVQAPHLYPKLAYDPISSFAPVAQLFDAPLWFAVATTVPARTVKEFVSLAKAPGAELSYASAGNGSTPHLYGFVLAKSGGVQLLHVPYKGIPPAVVDVAGGTVSSIFASYSDLVPHAQSGKLRILASTGTARARLTPELPTMAEAGYRGFESVGFGGILVPAGTPKPVIDKLSAVINDALALPDVKARLVTLGLEPVEKTNPAAFGELVKSQLGLWKGIIHEADVKLE